MPVTFPAQTNFLYRISYGSTGVERYTNVAEVQDYDGESYALIPITHTKPKFSAEPQESELTLTIHERNAIADLFTFGPPPFQIILRVFEYDRATETATPYWTGWIIRPSFDLDGSVISFHCKTLWHFFERESFSDSLSILSRYSVYDPRAGVDIESLRVGITVTALNDQRDVLTVTGITEPDDHFKGGLIIAPDRDMRTIIEHVTVSGDKLLTLNAAFPMFSLDTDFTADIYPGDDLTYATWASKFASVTNNGEAHGGWPFMPNVDPATKGVI
jgi:hypothetical protein